MVTMDHLWGTPHGESNGHVTGDITTSAKISNGYVTATCFPIHSGFGCTVEFSISADPLALLPVVMLENCK